MYEVIYIFDYNIMHQLPKILCCTTNEKVKHVYNRCRSNSLPNLNIYSFYK